MTEGSGRKLSIVKEAPPMRGAPKRKSTNLSALEARKLRNTNSVGKAKDEGQENITPSTSGRSGGGDMSEWLAIKRARESSGASSEPSFAQVSGAVTHSNTLACHY